MTAQTPMCVVTSGTSVGRARQRVLELFLADAFEVWPPTGAALEKLGGYASVREFWVGFEAGTSIIIRFSDTRVFRPPEQEATECWVWFLHQLNEHAIVRFLGRRTTLPTILRHDRSIEASAPAFRISFLRRAFHELKKLESRRDCLRAAAWLAQIPDDLLLPFRWLQHEESWDEWDRATPGSQLRVARARTFSAIADAERTQSPSGRDAASFEATAHRAQHDSASALWTNLCWTMEYLANQPNVDRLRSCLGASLMEWC